MRTTADGTVQVVVIVHDVPTKRRGPVESWGSILERTADGAWTELRRFALPGFDRRAAVHFGDASGAASNDPSDDASRATLRLSRDGVDIAVSEPPGDPADER